MEGHPWPDQRASFELGDQSVTEQTLILLMLGFEDRVELVDLFTEKA